MVCASPAPIFLFWAFGICLAALKLRRGVVFRWRNLSRKCKKNMDGWQVPIRKRAGKEQSSDN